MSSTGALDDYLDDLLGAAKSDSNPALISRTTHQDNLHPISHALDLQLLPSRKPLPAAARLTPPPTLDPPPLPPNPPHPARP